MVSGLVTSPCDQLRILSGEARLMRMLSKSVTLLPRSNGLERYKCPPFRFAIRNRMTEEPSYGARKFTHRIYFKISQSFGARTAGQASGAPVLRRSPNLLLQLKLDVLSL